jgi:hypothetical protein
MTPPTRPARFLVEGYGARLLLQVLTQGDGLSPHLTWEETDDGVILEAGTVELERVLDKYYDRAE